MIGRDVASSYDLDRLSIATLASHSALQIMHGAKAEGLRTLLVSTRERLPLYREFSHIIDEIVVVDRWRDLCRQDVVKRLRESNAILVPHGSLVEYVGHECAENIELPIFGLRTLFRVEASQREKMELLRDAGIPTPPSYSIDEDFEDLVIVKLPGAKGGKGYFIAMSSREVRQRLRELVERGLIKDPREALIQKYIVGVPIYIHYFYSPTLDRVEITGADIRYETNVDGLRRLPPRILEEIGIEPSFVVVGNIPVVLRESMLVKALDYGRRFAEATKRKLPPGIIGPYCLEAIATPNLEIVVFEFSGRIVAGTNLYVAGSPYTHLYWNEPMSVGRRIAREIRIAIEKNALHKVVT
ncbi:MAG: formate--phosphoribosylaminoimidazolecarboxamide ligase [Crenarchaeota archaeon]|nr:formate--phosphoribosylaminoimidazolecarboxamide ligase [Thermoproteota archaeon]